MWVNANLAMSYIKQLTKSNQYNHQTLWGKPLYNNCDLCSKYIDSVDKKSFAIYCMTCLAKEMKGCFSNVLLRKPLKRNN